MTCVWCLNLIAQFVAFFWIMASKSVAKAEVTSILRSCVVVSVVFGSSMSSRECELERDRESRELRDLDTDLT